ncbi:glycosyltransferase [Hydrocarboniphaga effusa]|uniref:glycosyltransferase n=1 Tax=Hydrocarboniphaga effusa TaxID=243629 RepID=UPI003137E9C1
MSGLSISVVTVTYNASAALPALIESLRMQTDLQFEWVVVDGGSSDSTVDLIKASGIRALRLISEPDYGIYDALNKAVRLVHTDFYLVLGADDTLAPAAIQNFRAVAQQADFIAASVRTSQGQLLEPMTGSVWKHGGNAIVSSHAVGTLIRTDLHRLIGFYSNRFPNCADMFFVLTAVTRHRVRVVKADFVAGTFGTTGVSSRDRLCSLSDAFRIQIELGANRWQQLGLYIWRLARALLQ